MVPGSGARAQALRVSLDCRYAIAQACARLGTCAAYACIRGAKVQGLAIGLPWSTSGRTEDLRILSEAHQRGTSSYL